MSVFEGVTVILA